MKISLQALERANVEPQYKYQLKSPELPPGVVPKGAAAPVLAQDANSLLTWLGAQDSQVVGFPGYSYLSQLAARAEYINLTSAISQELTRKWIELTATDEGQSEKIKAIEDRLETLDIRGKFQLAARHDCQFGRAQFYLDLKGHDRKLPLILSNKTVKPNSLKNISVVEAMWTTPSAYNALDPAAKDFYRPTSWFVLGQETHASRLITVITRPLPDILKPAFNFSGMSLTQMAEPYVDNWLRTRQSVSDLIYNFSLTALVTDLNAVLEGGSGDDLLNRIKLFQANRTNLGMMVMDKEREELVQINVPLSGLHELQAQSQEHICSVSRIPSMIYTGISPTGMNASSEGEIRAFYDWIAGIQQSYWSDPLNIILKLIQLDMFGEIDPAIGFRWLPLYEMTEEQRTNIRKINVDIDCALLDRGVIDQEQVATRLINDPDSGYEEIEVPELGQDGWVTFENGEHVKLGENGEILAGLGGKHTGKTISQISSKVLNFEQRDEIAKSQTLYQKYGEKGEGLRAKFKDAVMNGEFDHLHDELKNLKAAAAAKAKSEKKAKNDAYRAKHISTWVKRKVDREIAEKAAAKERREKAAAKERRENAAKPSSSNVETKPSSSNVETKPSSSNVAQQLPKYGRVREDDPSIYGNWLLGHEGELWSDIKHLGAKDADSYEGNDPGEVVIGNAKVVAKL